MKSEITNRADKRHIEAATGWLGLGNLVEANAELNEITPVIQAHPDVLQLRCKIYIAAEDWEMVAEIGRTLNIVQPEKNFGAMHHAHALRQLGRIEEARDVLLAVVEKFRENWRVSYALACYCSLLRDIPHAEHWIKQAIELAEPLEIRQKALDDPELQNTWVVISEI